MIDSADGVDLSLRHPKSSLEPPGSLNSRGAPYVPAVPGYMLQWREEDKPMAHGGGNSQGLFPYHWPLCLFYLITCRAALSTIIILVVEGKGLVVIISRARTKAEEPVGGGGVQI